MAWNNPKKCDILFFVMPMNMFPDPPTSPVLYFAKTRKRNLRVLFFIIFFLFSGFILLPLHASDMFTIKGIIDGITGNHSVYISLFDEKQWNNAKEIPLYMKQYSPDQIEDGRLRFSLRASPGEYLLTCFEDIDENGELTSGGLLRIPEEPFAFYREFNPFLALRKPAFKEICFSLETHIYNANMRMVKK